MAATPPRSKGVVRVHDVVGYTHQNNRRRRPRQQQPRTRVWVGKDAQCISSWCTQQRCPPITLLAAQHHAHNPLIHPPTQRTIRHSSGNRRQRRPLVDEDASGDTAGLRPLDRRRLQAPPQQRGRGRARQHPRTSSSGGRDAGSGRHQVRFVCVGGILGAGIGSLGPDRFAEPCGGRPPPPLWGAGFVMHTNNNHVQRCPAPPTSTTNPPQTDTLHTAAPASPPPSPRPAASSGPRSPTTAAAAAPALPAAASAARAS